MLVPRNGVKNANQCEKRRLRLLLFKRRALQSSASGAVPNAYWNRDNRQANVDRNDPENRNDNYGSSPAVRIG